MTRRTARSTERHTSKTLNSTKPGKSSKLSKNDFAVIIAAYNEEQHIADVVRGVRAQGFTRIIVADDGSRDKTQVLAEKAGATVIHHVTNLGKGAGMKTGADYARSTGAKALIFLDGDGQHKPEELPLFVNAINNGYALAFGYRKRTKTMPAIQRFGNWFLSVVIKTFYNMDLVDSQSGYRAMTIDAYHTVRWDSRDYSVESEIIARAGKNNLRYAQFEIATIYHDRYKGTTFLDGIPIMLNLVWWRMTH